MLGFSRRRFLQVFAAGTTQGATVARWSLSALGAAFLAGCRTIRKGFSKKPVRWIFPSTVGDFVIETPADLDKVSCFDSMLWAERVEFPAVAATMFEPEVSPGNDTDQVVVHDVWFVITAGSGTKLFRENDVVHSGEPRARATGDFSVLFDPQKLFKPFGPDAPVALDFKRGHGRWWTREKELAKLLRFNFCVDPVVCQTEGVRSTLPVVTTKWPEFDVSVLTTGGPVTLTRVDEIRSDEEVLTRCRLRGFGEIPQLRWLSATFATSESSTLVIPVRKTGDGHATTIEVPSSLQIRVRASVIDVVLPAGSLLRSERSASPLAKSHLLAGNHLAYAWLSDMPLDPTPLTPEISWDFCLVPDETAAAPWALMPQPIHLARVGLTVDLTAEPADVQTSKVSFRKRKGMLTASVEQQFGRVTASLRSCAPLCPSLQLTATKRGPIDLSIIDNRGFMRAIEPDVTATGYLMIEDLFVRPAGIAPLIQLNFDETSGGTFATRGSRMELLSRDVQWAGRYVEGNDAGNWAHLKRVAKGDSIELATLDQRGGSISLTQDVGITWDIFEGGFALDSQSSLAVGGEIVSLSAAAFRASIADTFPRRGDGEPLLLPSFALREHEHLKDAPKSRWIPGPGEDYPAFADLTMWEPRTTATFPASGDSPSDLFRSFAANDARAEIRAVYAGFRLNGSLVPLHDLEWSPDERLIKDLAPYRAIRGSEMMPVEAAIDVIDLEKTALRPEFKQAFGDARGRSLQEEFAAADTELALSPIGGTIGYDWTTPFLRVGLNELVLHGFLGRYQKNYAIFQDLLLPYGIRINVLALTARQDTGKLRYCTKWWFAEDSKGYGEGDNIIIQNLRPLNAVNFNAAEPLKFTADLHYMASDGRWVDRDRTLTGVGWLTLEMPCCPPALQNVAEHQSVALQKPQPLTAFDDTPLRVSISEWRSKRNVKDADRCVAPPPTPDPIEDAIEEAPPTPSCATPPPRHPGPTKLVEIAVTSSGELEDVKGMHFDSRRVDVTSTGLMSPDTGHWCEREDQKPVYHSKSLTLGDGVVRMNKPLTSEDRWELHGALEHVLTKKITLRDVALLQLIAGGSDKFLDNAGTMTIRQKMHVDASSESAADASASVEAIIEFAEFTQGISEICAQSLDFKIAATPRSFRASFLQESGQEAKYDVKLVADLGIPGFIRLKNCVVRSTPGSDVEFKPGDLDICGELMKQLLEYLIEIAKQKAGFGGGDTNGEGGGGSPFLFELLDKLSGFLVKLRIPMPSIPLGIGSIDKFGFDLRLGLALDFSAGGVNACALMTFIIGDFRFPGFGGVDWNLPNVRFADLVRRLFSKVERPTVIATPFVFRFGILFAARVRPPSGGLTGGFDVVCFDTAICIRAEAGLGVTFDVGIARGSVTLTIGIVWCPNATFQFRLSGAGPAVSSVFSMDEISLVVRVDAYASVLGLVNIYVYAEIIADLRLACREGVISHMEFSGTAHIEIGFVEFDRDFSVDLDPILGINPNACAINKGDPLFLCEGTPVPVWEKQRAVEAVRHFFGTTEVAA